MTVDLLSRLSAEPVESVVGQIRKAHSELPKEKCMGWLHGRRFPGRGGCDIHQEDA